jgi:hypothetical protein
MQPNVCRHMHVLSLLMVIQGLMTMHVDKVVYSHTAYVYKAALYMYVKQACVQYIQRVAKLHCMTDAPLYTYVKISCRIPAHKRTYHRP